MIRYVRSEIGIWDNSKMIGCMIDLVPPGKYEARNLTIHLLEELEFSGQLLGQF